jgi:hypothetical protein
MTGPGEWRAVPRPGRTRPSRAGIGVVQACTGIFQACIRVKRANIAIKRARIRTKRSHIRTKRDHIGTKRDRIGTKRALIKTLLTIARAVGFCSAQDCDRQASDHPRTDLHPSEERTIRAPRPCHSPTPTLKSMNWGRTIRRIAISLTLGAIVGVLVSWAVMFRDFKDAVSTTLVPGDWPIAVPSTWPAKPDEARRISGATWSALSLIQNRASWSEASRSRKASVLYVASVETFGWPFHGLKRYGLGTHNGTRFTQDHLGVFRQGVLIPASWQGRLPNRIQTIPIMPAWPGFLLNTLFYAALAWGVLAARSWEIRGRRRRRGLCVQCAYPTTGLHRCPECGTAVRGAAKIPGTPAEPIGSTPVLGNNARE